jgi:hypothetical protein
VHDEWKGDHSPHASASAEEEESFTSLLLFLLRVYVCVHHPRNLPDFFEKVRLGREYLQNSPQNLSLFAPGSMDPPAKQRVKKGATTFAKVDVAFLSC